MAKTNKPKGQRKQKANGVGKMSGLIRLDDLYKMTAFIYSERNAERPPSITFTHLVEVCGLLIEHDHEKDRDETAITETLCKALGWYFPLLARFNIESVEDLIFRKYPLVCPYCRLEKHDSRICKNVIGEKSINKAELQAKYSKNKGKKPKSLDEWRAMFDRIYGREPTDFSRSAFGLIEELGELAEAIRVFDRHPKYFVGEAADVFSYLMGFANEQILNLRKRGQAEYSLEAEFLRHYPGLCMQCGNFVCKCPPIPEATVGRMAKELDIDPNDPLFKLNHTALEKTAKTVSLKVLEHLGGYATVAQHFPLDRGETNKALVILCLKLGEMVSHKNPELEKKLRDAAVLAGSTTASPGSHPTAEGKFDQVVDALRMVLPSLDLAVFQKDNSLPFAIGRLLQLGACKFGIVTALPKEATAMRLMFEEEQEQPMTGDPNNYFLGTIPAKDGSGKHLVVLTLLKSKGNNSAAAAAANLLRSFESVTDVLMVGIAGGIPNIEKPQKHVRLGDIVISDKQGVIEYDNIKVDQKTVEFRGSSIPPSASMIGKVNVLESDRLLRKRPWEEYIGRGEPMSEGRRPAPASDNLFAWAGLPRSVKHPRDPDRREGLPKLHFGRIGSANVLLKNPEIRDLLGDQLNIIAVEMEGSGIADGAWTHGKHYILIRGICDYCDPAKGDQWHGYAAVVAAAYARAIIESFPASNVT